jgi:hypothetical protein
MINDNLSKIELWIENKRFKESILNLNPLLENLQYEGLSNYHIRFILKTTLDYCIQSLENLNSTYYKDPGQKIIQKDNIFTVIDKVFEVSPKNYKNTNHLYMFKIEQAYGVEIFKKHKINYSNPEYLKDKFSYALSEKIKSYYDKTNSPNDSENIIKYNQTLDDIAELVIQNKIKLDFLKTKIEDSSLIFCLAIELGFQPSQKEILNSFCTIWNSCRANNLYELNFFCESLSQTNVFINTLAPSKNLPQSIKNFFKIHMNKQSTHNNYAGRLASHEDKEQLLLNNPLFMYKNMDEKLLRTKALKHLGKATLNNQEKDILNNIIKESQTPNKKKLKI